MKKQYIFALIIFAFIFTSHARVAQNLPGEPPAPGAVPGQLVVKLASHSPAIGPKAGQLPAHSLAMKYRHRLKSIRPHATGCYILDTYEQEDLEVLEAQLSTDPLVEKVSLNYIASFMVAAPDDPLFANQYALYNNGQVYRPDTGDAGAPGSDIKALSGWDWATGDDVIIAIIDTGIAHDHEDLANRVIEGYNFVDDNENAYDDHGHGTFAASIAAAETGNGIGMAGVCWHARLMPLKAADSDGYASYLAIGAALRHAADHGARVINISLGGFSPSFILEDACKYAYEKGCVIAASAGNNAGPVLYPAAYDDYCLAVGACNAKDEIASWSNYGTQVDVVAPGVDVLGALFLPGEPDVLNGYGWDSGTSFSTPYVAGAAALLISIKPHLSNEYIMKMIMYTADDVNASILPGVDELMGYGRINLNRLLGPYELN